MVKRKGKQFRKSPKTNNRKLAERRLREVRAKIGQLMGDSQERKTPFKVLAKRWLKIHNSSLKASSADRNRRCVKEVNKFFGDIPVSEISKRHGEDWMAARGAGIAASTCNKDAEVLKSVLKYAVEDGLILDNPALVIKRRRIVNKEILIPSKDEYERLLEAITELDPRSSDSGTLIQLLALSGMRLGEATRIVWRESDIAKKWFTVSGGDVGTKNGETRIVPLFPNFKRFIKRLHDERQPSGGDRLVCIESSKSAIYTAC